MCGMDSAPHRQPVMQGDSLTVVSARLGCFPGRRERYRTHCVSGGGIRKSIPGSQQAIGAFSLSGVPKAGAFLLTGAVFLPAAGYRNGTSVNNAGSNGNYWSSSPYTSNVNNAYNVNFNAGNLNPQNNNNRYNGRAVRLVRVSVMTPRTVTVF